VIFSNKDFRNGVFPGLQLLRLKNGNFGAYGGVGRIIDSGVKLTSGGYHLVALKRTQNKFFLSVDDVPGNSDVATYFSSYEAKNILAGLIEVGRYSTAKAMLGAPGNNPTPPSGSGFISSNGYDFHKFDFWKGNIASLSIYSSALTDDEIKTLAQCAPQAYRVATPKNVGPGYPVPSPETDGKVTTMLLNNKVLYVGGEFENFGAQPRFHLAALDTEKSNAITSWAPVIHGLSVRALAISGNTLYVGGNFLRVNGVDRNFLAAIDLTTGSLIANWNPNPDGEITSLAVSNNYLFVGGKFTSIGGSDKKYLASFDISNRDNILLRTAWNVTPNDDVNTLLVLGNLLYFGGDFSYIGDDNRRRLAAANVTDGSLATWNPGAFYGEVLSLAASGDTLYVGGDFDELGNPRVTRSYLGAIHKDTGEVLNFNPAPNNTVHSITATMNGLYIGGYFRQIGSTTRNYVAELNADGTPTNWNPNPDGSVFSIVPLTDRSYLGGEFKNLNNQKAFYFGTIAK
jgi:hypothetical protein